MSGEKKKHSRRTKTSRREFLQVTSTVAVGAAAAATGCRETKKGSGPAKKGGTAERTSRARGKDRSPASKFPPPQPPKTGRSRVVLIRDADVLDERGRVRAKVIQRMLDEAVTALTDAASAGAAWKSLLKPDDVLGIKTNEWKHLPTPKALENALHRRARGVGIPAANIRMDDRGARENLSSCTALVNARPLRSHHWAGIGGCLKNYIMFVERPWEYHPDACADLGALWNLPATKGKTRLNVLVLLTPLFHGRGPHHFNAQYLWPYRGLLVSKDPVAADRVGLEILRAKRRLHFGQDKPFATRTSHVGYADTRHGVGVADLGRIDLKLLGWKQDLLLPG